VGFRAKLGCVSGWPGAFVCFDKDLMGRGRRGRCSLGPPADVGFGRDWPEAFDCLEGSLEVGFGTGGLGDFPW
jgi:hypothetical protein